MKHVWAGLAGVLILFLFTGCSQSEGGDWHNSEREAVLTGLEKEGTDILAVLSIERVKGETLVFFEQKGGLGIASITKSEKGYSWYRSEPFLDFETEGSLPYTTAEFEYETERGVKVPVLAGKVFDPTVKKIKLIDFGIEKEFLISKRSSWFYTTPSTLAGEHEVITLEE